MYEIEDNYQLPSEYADNAGITYSGSTSEKHKKHSGQFFTPRLIAEFMGNLSQPHSTKISILDPGCGTAILSCALIESLITKKKIEEIELTLFETDSGIIEETKKVTLFLKEWLIKQGISLNISIKQNDFILSNTDVFSQNTLFENKRIKKYDYIISNPPYFKIPKSDIRSQTAKELVYGQPNIYSLFLGLSAKLLKSDGELIFITPRSFAAGNYFKAFRNSFFREVSISDIHIFESRKKMFKNDNVLQENIIIRATKKTNQLIRITVSESESGLKDITSSVYRTEDLIDLSSKDKILFIPSNTNEADAIKVFKEWRYSLNHYNIEISTGPVVAFRCQEFLIPDYTPHRQIVPLLWLHNVKKMESVFPLKKKNKPSYIISSKASKRVLIKNKNYILIRRFSTKDDKSRLICAPYFASSNNVDYIGIENHVNYIYRPNGELSENEIWGIVALFNSSLFDAYFRTFNGNTQVGAFELKQIKMPPLEKIILIGEYIKIIPHLQREEEIDKIITKILFGTPYFKSRRSTANFAHVGIT